MSAVPPIKTTAADYSEVRQGLLRMRFPADDDTTMRLNDVINSKPVKWVIDGNERLPRWRKVLRWLKRR